MVEVISVCKIFIILLSSIQEEAFIPVDFVKAFNINHLEFRPWAITVILYSKQSYFNNHEKYFKK
jgi:hypothetical protein